MSEVTEEIRESEADDGRSTVAKAADHVVEAGLHVLGPAHAHTQEHPHLDHGYAPARWTAAVISIIGWLIGGIAFPFGVVPLVVVGGALQVVAVVVNLSMNAAGLGARVNDQWATAKADARAARAAAEAA